MSSWFASFREYLKYLRRIGLNRASGYVLWRDVTSAEAKPQAEADDLRLRALTLDELRQTTDWAAPMEEVQRRLDGGSLCVGIVSSGEVLFVHWFSPGTTYLLGADMLLLLKPTQFYAYGAVTKPSVRGRGVFGAGVRQLAAWTRSQGAEQIVVYVEAKNTASLKVGARTGYELSPKLVSYRLLGIRFGYHWDPAAGLPKRRVTNRDLRRNFWI